ncbi:BTB/POZ protein [Rhizophagus irregularis DAOM 181602=DAOM 197198]|nr:BTB/POZ protein [Rhizophagus irregularis DAOM 181602=DAOM 197198]
MDDNKFLPKLSQNLLEILNDDEYYDITIEVGNDPYKNDETLTHIKLPNISPEIFQIILRYIYGGRLPLKEYDASDIIKILIAANELKTFLNLSDPSSKPNNESKPHMFRETPKLRAIDSKIITYQHAELILKWVNSRVMNEGNAIINNFLNGPSFGKDDFIIWSMLNGNYCKKVFYEKPIRKTTNQFTIEECEVFKLNRIDDKR